MTKPDEYIITENQIKALETIAEINNDQATLYTLQRGALRSRPICSTTSVDTSTWTHDEIMNRLQCAYDKGFITARKKYSNSLKLFISSSLAAHENRIVNKAFLKDLLEEIELLSQSEEA